MSYKYLKKNSEDVLVLRRVVVENLVAHRFRQKKTYTFRGMCV